MSADQRETDFSKFDAAAVGFVDALRQEGIVIPIGATINYVRALSAVADLNRSARYWCGRATLVTRPEDFMTYHKVFGRYWTGAEFADELGVELHQTTVISFDDAEEGDQGADDDGDDAATPDISMRYSSIEVLREKDFAEYTKDELREAEFLMQKMRLLGSTRRSRRQRHSKRVRGNPHLARTVRNALRSDGETFKRAYTEPGEQTRRLVLLLDISGSMESYARALLRFVHVSVVARRRVEAFALGTRLTRLTRELSTLDPDRAFDSASAAVLDWSGGTRLGESLRVFNDEWGVRGMARGAIVVILSDGWDRGDPAEMAEQMQRLQRVAHRIVWSNPLKASDGYAPLAQGMAAALPYVHNFIEGHSLSALQELARVITLQDEPKPYLVSSAPKQSEVA